MAEKLLGEFPSASTAEWEAVIAKDLKGAEYEKKLVWRTAEGLAVKPYYRAEDVAGFDWLKAAPGEFPFVRGAHDEGGWLIRETIDHTDPVEANRAARAAVAAGAEEISFTKINTANISDLALLLGELDTVPVHIVTVEERFLQRLMGHLKKVQRTAVIATGLDPLKDVEVTARIAKVAPAGFIPFTIEATRFEESGGSAVDEIGFALAAGIDYLTALQERDVDVPTAAWLLKFNFAIGRNYFMQIGKFRAFRMLWAKAVESFGAPAAAGQARIGARTSRWNKTVYDPHVNVLRNTTEAMSAVLGGANSISVAAFDECYRQPDEASRRLARNTQIMLKREAMLERVADPGGGSYALETITDFLVREGWKRMQEVESLGGFRKAAARIQQVLDQAMAAREKAVAMRRRAFVGTNKFANAAEKELAQIDMTRMNAHRRGTRAYEDLRLRTECSGKSPLVLLAAIGDPKMRAARAAFAASFIACAGFVTTLRRFKTVDEILTNQADVIVLCSSDPEYAALAAELLPKLKAAGRNALVIVAGNPENANELKAAGVDDFIHVQSNPLEVLGQWQRRLGIKD